MFSQVLLHTCTFWRKPLILFFLGEITSVAIIAASFIFSLTFIKKQYVIIIREIIKPISPKRCEPVIGGRNDRQISEFTLKRIHTWVFICLEMHDVPQESFIIYQVNLHCPRNMNISSWGVGIWTVFKLIRHFLL